MLGEIKHIEKLADNIYKDAIKIEDIIKTVSDALNYNDECCHITTVYDILVQEMDSFCYKQEILQKEILKIRLRFEKKF